MGSAQSPTLVSVSGFVTPPATQALPLGVHFHRMVDEPATLVEYFRAGAEHIRPLPLPLVRLHLLGQVAVDRDEAAVRPPVRALVMDVHALASKLVCRA